MPSEVHRGALPEEGLEPSPCCQDGILNPARLPIPPLRLDLGVIIEQRAGIVNIKIRVAAAPSLVVYLGEGTSSVGVNPRRIVFSVTVRGSMKCSR